MANKRKKTVARKPSRTKKATPSPKKKAVKKTVKKRAAVKASKPASKKKIAKKAADKSVKKAPKAGPPSVSAKKVADEEDAAPRKSVAAKPAMSIEPEEADLDEDDETVSDELEMEGGIEEDDVQEELDLDADEDGDELINKSEDLLDDDYRHN
ncbi:MAG TPA: hypothetical protein VLE46_09655 [Nitrospira sp.]|nr:hypothetical protein [Nitrospira sp.]